MIQGAQKPKTDVAAPNGKPSVLVLIPHYLPGYKAGGPISSLAAWVEMLGDEFQFKIVTSDRDLGDSVPFPNVRVGEWVSRGKAQVMYLPAGREAWRMLYRLLKTHSDCLLYINGLCPRRFSLFPVLLRRLRLIRPLQLIMAPRGELHSGALSCKPRRKSLFRSLSRLLSLYSDAIWHASCQQEEADIRAYLRPDRGGAVVFTASDLALQPALVSVLKTPKRPGHLRVVYLGCISPAKNLSMGLDVLRNVTGEVRFRIYGPIVDSEYWQTCTNAIEKLPASIQVDYRGVVPHDSVYNILAENDLFLLPTKGENFGHVILEALRAGCPVLTTDETPWGALTEEGAGWALPLNEPGWFTGTLQACVGMGHEEMRAMSERAVAFGFEHWPGRKDIEDNRRLLRHAFRRGHDATRGAEEAVSAGRQRRAEHTNGR